MALPECFTFDDALSNLEDFSQSWNAAGSQAILKRCIRQARDEIVVAHDASFLQKRGRILLRAAQTGDAVYDHTGGATCERQLTTVSPTWPGWATDASVRFGDMVCDVQEYKTTTVVQLDSVMNPGQDVASASYTMYPRHYALPPDFLKMISVAEESSWLLGEYVSPAAMFALDRYSTQTGDPRKYTVAAVPDQLGLMGLFLFPPSDTTEPLLFLYKRKLRDLRYAGRLPKEYTGTVQVAVDGITVNGTSTEFEFGPSISPMVGAILRIAGNSSKPTGLEGNNPWQEQRVIHAVTNATTLTMDGVTSTNILTDRGYVISDPIDVDGTFWTAFLRCCEKHYGIARNIKNKRELVLAYEDALVSAKRGDSRMGGRQVCSVPGESYSPRLTESTSRPEVP